MKILKNKYNLKYKKLKFYLYKNNIYVKILKNKIHLILKIKIKKKIFFIKNNKIFFIKNIINKKLLLYYFKYFIINYLYNYKFYNKIYNIGLGFKNFIYKNYLFLLLGNSNYYKLKIPNNIYIICKKNQIYFFSNNKIKLNNFLFLIKNLKKINLYKGKGLINFYNFKFMKLKMGKKKI